MKPTFAGWLLALGACTLFAGCTMDCLSSVPCCASCDDAQPNYRCGGCEAAETSALLCPQRSSCALSYFVGDEPARCCSRCDSTEIRERDNKRCEQKESYVHECRVESACVQAHLALARDAVYVPWQAAALNTAAALFSVAVSGDEVWAVGSSGFAARLSSSGRWQLETTPTTENLLGVWVSPAGTVWVVGIDGSILRRDQAGWQKVESPTNVALQAIWGRDETHIWAVGQSATVLEYDGINWRQLSSATDVDLTAIGGNADQLWIVGDKGVILRRDGPNENGFSAVESGTDLPLTGVYVSSSDNRSPSDNKVWIVGVGGLFLHGDHTGFVIGQTHERFDLLAVGQAAGSVWTVGRFGAIWRGADGQLERVSYFLPRPVDLFAVAGDGKRAIAVGEAGLSLFYESVQP
jgi:photosystem II stability/assembly factor-like uncharacterized protein